MEERPNFASLGEPQADQGLGDSPIFNQHPTRPQIRPKIRYKKWYLELRRRPEKKRDEFQVYCKQAASSAQSRSKKHGLPCDIDPAFLQLLLASQEFRCAVTGIPLELTARRDRQHHRDAFGPSLDRIIPSKGYVRSNVRITCSIVNMAMNEWGLGTLLKMVDAMKDRPR